MIKCPRCESIRLSIIEGSRLDADYFSNCWRCHGTGDVTNEVTQVIKFTKMTTDHLLSWRRQRNCQWPSFAGEKDLGYKGGEFLGFPINHVLLREELAKRPHRVRARSRRNRDK